MNILLVIIAIIILLLVVYMCIYYVNKTNDERNHNIKNALGDKIIGFEIDKATYLHKESVNGWQCYNVRIRGIDSPWITINYHICYKDNEYHVDKIDRRSHER